VAGLAGDHGGTHEIAGCQLETLMVGTRSVTSNSASSTTAAQMSCYCRKSPPPPWDGFARPDGTASQRSNFVADGHTERHGVPPRRHAKVAQAGAIARAVEHAGTPVAIGMDRNGPKFERWQSAATEWWPQDPVHFFDDTASHGCRDVLDRWYSSNPDALRAAMHEWPDGPHEVSYVEHRADLPIYRRYALIMVTSGFDVLDVRYRYSDAIEAASDHGLVEATIRSLTGSHTGATMGGQAPHLDRPQSR
jgi:hypothetical protein